MLNWLKNLDAKLETSLEPIDRLAAPIRSVLNFEVFRVDGEETLRAAELLRLRRDDVEIASAQDDQAEEWCSPLCLSVEQSQA